MQPVLIVFGGLPGTGKTTISRALAVRKSAMYLRIDEIEHRLRAARVGADIGSQGYVAAEAIALSNLRLGHWVVADCVNPVAESRQAWRDVAAQAASPLLEIELICSDAAEHRRRVEDRVADIAGFRLPDWASVEAHDYAAWTEPRFVLDTAGLSPADAMTAIETRIDAIGKEWCKPPR